MTSLRCSDPVVGSRSLSGRFRKILQTPRSASPEQQPEPLSPSPRASSSSSYLTAPEQEVSYFSSDSDSEGIRSWLKKGKARSVTTENLGRLAKKLSQNTRSTIGSLSSKVATRKTSTESLNSSSTHMRHMKDEEVDPYFKSDCGSDTTPELTRSLGYNRSQSTLSPVSTPSVSSPGKKLSPRRFFTLNSSQISPTSPSSGEQRRVTKDIISDPFCPMMDFGYLSEDESDGDDRSLNDISWTNIDPFSISHVLTEPSSPSSSDHGRPSRSPTTISPLPDSRPSTPIPRTGFVASPERTRQVCNPSARIQLTLITTPPSRPLPSLPKWSAQKLQLARNELKKRTSIPIDVPCTTRTSSHKKSN